MLVRKRVHGLWLGLLLPLAALAAPEVDEAPLGEAVERHMPAEGLTQWTHDPELLENEAGDRLEVQEVLADDVEIVKLRDIVPPVRFESGVADIPPGYIQRLRGVLDSMRHLTNVRLHLVGHADDQPLSSALAGVYGDNAGLSRERAGEVAEFIQAALALPPESISFEWAGDTQPVASNATPEGRALNRRVEVEVWYDEVGQKVETREVVVPEEIKRVKVCRVETVCKLRYREGHELRARIRNLVAPLNFEEDAVGVPAAFIEQVRQGLDNLRTKQNVTVKFIGFTDDQPLAGRAERIYGNHLALSKARAHRVALAVRDALALPAAAIASDGRGAAQPVASNATEAGRARNNRVEVEFWHDDPLQELPDEPQMCPDAASAEVVTRVYEPPWGRLEPVPVQHGDPVFPTGYAQVLRRALDDVAGEANVRLRFVGYTGNERLDRRTALVYGDDIGLSAARARRAMEAALAELGLEEAQAEHEGRGYVHSSDVVNGGFLQGEDSYVTIQVVYDELAVLDDYDGVDVTPITRELRPKDPLALNLMRITVDGEPIDDPGRSSADIQRCTDVALDRADIRFRFDDLEVEPRLSVTARPESVPTRQGVAAEAVSFRMYTNYPSFIERAEVRVFEKEQSTRGVPVGVAPVGPDGLARWQPEPSLFQGPVRELKYVLRVYGQDGVFDETVARPLWMVNGEPKQIAEGEEPEGLLSGYGESEISARSIALGGTGSVRVDGTGVPPQHTVWLAGKPVPVDEGGNFVAETILPAGTHTVEVAILDPEGNGELFLRDLEVEENDWFYVGMADVTFSGNKTSGPMDALTGADSPYDYDSLADGRLAFFLSGRFGEDFKLTASADTREEPVKDLFSNFMEKSPEALFRRIDPEYYYPTFGDDGTVEEAAPTSGKFFVKLNKGESHAMWGNFKVGYLDNELAHVDRGLYGANIHYQSPSATGFGEQRLVVDGFAAEPGTAPSREEFRGTGGSLYFLRRQDLLVGSERVRVEIRDKDSGIVSGVVHLQPSVDYDIDYLQGRVLLSEPIGAIVDDDLLVRTGGLSGDEAWLVVQYEYTPGFDELDALAGGGQGQVWLTDFMKLGLTANRNDDDGSDSSLYAGDLILRRSSETWFKLQAGRSEGLVSSSLRSDDGGFQFLGATPVVATDENAGAYRADLRIGFGDIFEGREGHINLYGQLLDEGYSAPGMNTFADTDQFGGSLRLALTDYLRVDAKADHLAQKDGLELTTNEVDLGYQLTNHFDLSAGVRHEFRDDDSPLVPLTQEEGQRTDAVLQLGYDSLDRWRSYTFAQTTVASKGDMEDNQRFGLGGAYRISERLFLDGEVSHGDGGPGAKIGSTFQQTDRTSYYLNYALENERGDEGLGSRGGSLITGARSRLSDSASVYMENRYQHSGTNGLTQALGMTLTPGSRWNLGFNWESGTLTDRLTNAEVERRAGGASVGYAFDKVQLSSGVEYRFDESEALTGTTSERTTWLFRNNFKFQMTPDWRMLGTFNHSFSDSSQGQFYDGGYTKAVMGYAYRPVLHDRLNALLKYTYFYNLPTTDQLSLLGTPNQFIQKSHVAALDLSYDFTSYLTLGGKYAYRLGQVSLDRDDPEFFDNSAHLYILRSDLRFLKNWESSLEGRMLDLTDLDEQRTGALVTLYRYFGDHLKVGVGYNFTDFSDDLTDLSYNHHGWFFNVVGSL